MKNFKKHFRVYLVNNHPSFIIDEEGNEYIFHRMTKSKTSGNKKNWLVTDNPIEGCDFECYIVKREEKDNKNRFSKQILKTKKNVDTNLEWIKRVKKK